MSKAMCFSASASFVAAGATGVAGIIALTRVNEAREVPLAATPLFFALQQSIEGMLWLDLPSASDGLLSATLTLLYLVFAEVFWPLYAAIAAWLIERSQRRRHLMAICLVFSASVGGYLLCWMLGRPYSAKIADSHIAYVPIYWQPYAAGVAYVAVAGFPLLLSSQRTVLIFGVIILLGLIVARAFYVEAFISVWCFFAAMASIAILLHFELLRRSRLHGTGG